MGGQLRAKSGSTFTFPIGAGGGINSQGEITNQKRNHRADWKMGLKGEEVGKKDRLLK